VVSTDPVGVDAQLCGRDLERNGVHALAHFGPTVTHFHPVVVGSEAHHRRALLVEAVAEAGVLQPEPEPDGLAGLTSRIVERLDLVEARFGAAGTLVHDLTRAPHVSRPDHVALADLPPGDADQLGEPVEDTLHRELGLVRAEASERTAHQVVRAHRGGLTAVVSTSIAFQR